jgi:hypothetical protein
MQILAEESYRETGQIAATTKEMARWAITTGKWRRHDEVALQQCAEDFAQAMREEYETDPKGRRVRTKYAASIEENGQRVTKWGDRKRVTREFVEVSAKQRRNQIVGDCYQQKIDIHSYNEYHNRGEPIQIPFDFTPDMEELEELAKRRNRAS